MHEELLPNIHMQPPVGDPVPPPPNGIKLQTSNLTPANSAPNSGNRSDPNTGSAQSWEPNEEEHEIITGPSLDEDDSLAAPPPTIRQGRESDNAIRKKRFSKYSVYPNPFNSTIRTVSPEAARALSPQGRNGNTNSNSMVSLAKSTNVSPESSTGRQSINFSRNPSPQTMSPPGAITPATYKPTGSNSIASGVSTPATYHTATAYRHSSSSQTPNQNPSPPNSYAHSYAHSYAPTPATMSRQSLLQQQQTTHPAPPPPSSNISRSSLILPTHQQQQQQHPLSPTVSRASLISQASRMAAGPPAAVSTATPNKDVGRRGSRATLSGMSPTVQALYGQHERDWRRSQQVLPEELVAKGLDEGVFAGLR
jgi:hypothetical protein